MKLRNIKMIKKLDRKSKKLINIKIISNYIFLKLLY